MIAARFAAIEDRLLPEHPLDHPWAGRWVLPLQRLNLSGGCDPGDGWGGVTKVAPHGEKWDLVMYPSRLEPQPILAKAKMREEERRRVGGERRALTRMVKAPGLSSLLQPSGQTWSEVVRRGKEKPKERSGSRSAPRMAEGGANLTRPRGRSQKRQQPPEEGQERPMVRQPDKPKGGPMKPKKRRYVPRGLRRL